jgi:hypothetical protein
MNVEIGTEAVQFPEKEYINGIFVAVYSNFLTKKICSRAQFRVASVINSWFFWLALEIYLSSVGGWGGGGGVNMINPSSQRSVLMSMSLILSSPTRFHHISLP